MNVPKRVNTAPKMVATIKPMLKREEAILAMIYTIYGLYDTKSERLGCRRNTKFRKAKSLQKA